MHVLSLTHCHSLVMEARWTCSCKTVNMSSSSCLVFLLLVLTEVWLLLLPSWICLTIVFLQACMAVFSQFCKHLTICTTNHHHHHHYYHYTILDFNTTLCFEPFGCEVPLLTILQLSLFIIWVYISYTWLIVSHDIVLALSRTWTFYYLVVFLSSYWGSWRWW
jgi:hypothetical protein